jgi:hypothetical protein
MVLAGAGMLAALLAYRFVRANRLPRGVAAVQEPAPLPVPPIDVALTPGAAPGVARLEVFDDTLVGMEIALTPMADGGRQALTAERLVGDERRIYE